MAIFGDSPYLALSEDGTEIIFRRFDTPRPWSNYLTNGDYTAIVTHLGAGFSFLYESMYNQILHSGNLTLTEPIPGRYLYLRDDDTGRCWNPTVAPAMEAPDAFEARHAPGWTTLTSAQHGIETTVTFFVPLDRNEERWVVRLRNTGRTARRLRLYSYCELVLGNLLFHRYGPIDYNLFNTVRFEDNVLVITRSRHQDFYGDFATWPYAFYAYSDRDPAGWDVSKESFLGRWRTVLNPETVEGGVFKQNLAVGSQAIASFGWGIDLEPGETQTLTLALGVTGRDSPPPVDRRPETTERLLRAVREHWRRMLETSTIETPDEALNVETNTWVKYQAVMLCLTWRTFISLYGCSGGSSFRNVAQDLYGIMPVVPEKARDTIEKMAGYIKRDGSPSQMTLRPEMGFRGNEADKSDFLPWYLFVVNDYVKETGDKAVLDAVVPYMDGGSGTLQEHLVRGIQAVLDRKGPHGLPLIKFGDWNDALTGIGRKGKGESVWLAQFLYMVLGEAIELFTAAGKTDAPVAKYRAEREALRESVNTHAWNGEYFVRAFTDDGVTLGDKDCEEGRIYLNTQTWAVTSGIAEAERNAKCLAAAERELATDKGYLLFSPAYTARTKLDLGVISHFAPGTKENGAVFSHANAFALVALAKDGRGGEAYRLYRRFSPFSRSASDIERSKIEPYVFCQYINAPESDKPGEAWYPWTTGTAGWALRGVTDWMLGVRAEHEGLRIDPCIPPEWETFRVKRRFRGATYHITVTNPQHVEKGVKEVVVDGKRIGSNLVPLPSAPRDYEVRVRMG